MRAASNRRTWAAVALCAAAYLYVFPYFPKINNPNENVRLYMTAAIVEHGTYRIDALRDRWGWVNDAAVHGGHVYSVKAPGTSLLGVPGYAIYHWGTRAIGGEPQRDVALWVCRVTASILPTLLFLFFFHRWLDRRTEHPTLRDTVFLSVAVGSLLFGYAILFVSHTLSAVAAFGAFMMLFDARRGGVSARGAFGAGFLTAAVTLFEYPGVVVSAVLAVYGLVVLRGRHRLWPFVLGGLVPTILVMQFQWAAFGNPFTPGHLYVESDAFRAAHHEGLYGATGFHADAAWQLLVDFGLGLFPLTPILVFAVLGFPRLLLRRETRLDAAVALAAFVLTWLVISFMNNWRGGWTIGPRYLAVVVPFVGWAAVEGLDLTATRAPRLIALLAVGATGTALVASGIPSAYYPHLPPEFTRPLSQLFWVLIGDGYAPHNAGNLFGWWGTASMMPLFALGFFALAWAAWQPRYAKRDRLSILAGGILVGGLLLGPLLQEPRGETDPRVADAVAFVTRHWTPEGHDEAAELRTAIEAGGPDRFDHYRALAELYRSQGREHESRAVAEEAEREAERMRGDAP